MCWPSGGFWLAWTCIAVQQPLACSSRSLQGTDQPSPGAYTQTPGATPRKVSRILQLGRRVNGNVGGSDLAKQLKIPAWAGIGAARSRPAGRKGRGDQLARAGRRGFPGFLGGMFGFGLCSGRRPFSSSALRCCDARRLRPCSSRSGSNSCALIHLPKIWALRAVELPGLRVAGTKISSVRAPRAADPLATRSQMHAK